MHNDAMTVLQKRPHYYVLEKLYTELALILLPGLARTPVTPNQITVANYANGFLIMGLIASRHYVPAAVLIQLYLLLDILDGNLARYTHRTSRLGQVLDNFGDRFFYNGVVIVLGLTFGNHWGWIVGFLAAHNLHSAVATFYIVPKIRKLPQFKRFAFKQWLMDRGTIFGMDLSSQDLVMSVLLLTPWRGLIVPLLAFLYGADLVFRLIELLWAVAHNPHPCPLPGGEGENNVSISSVVGR